MKGFPNWKLIGVTQKFQSTTWRFGAAHQNKNPPVFHSYKTHLTTRTRRPWRNFGGLKNAEKRKKPHGRCLLAVPARAMLCARLHAKLKHQDPTRHWAD
jgi:hypothetical protein